MKQLYDITPPNFDRANVKAAGAMRIILNQRQTCPKLDTAMEDSTPLQSNPPEWIDSEDLAGLPDAFTDKRELWEMVATCTPRSCISAHYSSLTLRVVADFIEHRMEQAAANGWKYQPWRIVNDLRIAALTADLAIEDGDCLDTAMEDSTPLQSNPPEWIDSEDLAGLPDAFTDKRELWEMVATCTSATQWR
jgi:hypothetical protein